MIFLFENPENLEWVDHPGNMAAAEKFYNNKRLLYLLETEKSSGRSMEQLLRKTRGTI